MASGLRRTYRFGEHLPLMRREDFRAFTTRRPVCDRPLSLKAARKLAELMELETERFYEVSARRVRSGRPPIAGRFGRRGAPITRWRRRRWAGQNDRRRGRPVRRSASPCRSSSRGWRGYGRLGFHTRPLVDHHPKAESGKTFLVGLAASIGAGISTGVCRSALRPRNPRARGHPGRAAGSAVRTTAAGGKTGTRFHFSIFAHSSATAVALGVACVELGVIAWSLRQHGAHPGTSATLQVVLGGALVFLVGMLIGSSFTIDKLNRKGKIMTVTGHEHDREAWLKGGCAYFARRGFCFISAGCPVLWQGHPGRAALAGSLP